MDDAQVLETACGPVVLRPEEPADGDFLYALFRSHALSELAPLPIDDAGREALVHMQFVSQTSTYRTQFPGARFDIVERDGTPIGRLIVDGGAEAACIVDFALAPECRGAGTGTAILASVLARQARWSQAVRCKVLWNNEPSLRMCRRVGFVHVGGELPFLQLEWRAPKPAGKSGAYAN